MLTNETGVSRHNLTNKLWHDKNTEAASQLFGFKSFQETMLHVEAFFDDVKLEHQKVVIKSNKIEIKPSYLTDLEQLLIAKLFTHHNPHRTKLALNLDISRQAISHQIKKWLPLWATHGSHLSILPMPHDYYEKELPECYAQNNLKKSPIF